MSSTLDRSRHDALLAEGRDALLAGDKARAQKLLQTAVQLDPRSEDAWMWLSGVFSRPEDMAECLRRVLEINPRNEQALEGLRWLEAEHGLQLRPLPPSEAPAEPPIAEPVRLHPPAISSYSSSLLLESALYPAAAGAWLGLLRLLGWLRPETLRLLRGAEGPLSWVGSLGVAATALALHGLALGLVWLLLGWQLSRARGDGRGDLFDSLVRTGQIWIPGYLWLGAVVFAALALDLSPGPWRIAVVAIWLLLLSGAALVGRRLWRVLSAVGIAGRARSRSAARLFLLLLLGSVLGLGLAGIATAALLR
jgi:tetratricopeptide (TPR) repeat protein